jgi:ABC-type transport system substrate-binding protein
MIGYPARLAFAAPAALVLASPGTLAQAQGTLRIAMTASGMPTTTGAPDNGFEGLRFLGYPVYEGVVLWDLTRADKLAEIRPGLAESSKQDENDKSKWIFHLRHGSSFTTAAISTPMR